MADGQVGVQAEGLFWPENDGPLRDRPRV